MPPPGMMPPGMVPPGFPPPGMGMYLFLPSEMTRFSADFHLLGLAV